MKTLFYRFMALIVAIATIVGCERDHLSSNGEAQHQTLVVAAPSGNPDTKIGVTSNEGDALGFKVKWEVGDRIHVSSADGVTYIGSFKIGAGDIAADGSATFSSENDDVALTAGCEYKFYTNKAWGAKSYNEAMSYPDSEIWTDVDDENFNVEATLHSPDPIEFGGDPIVLEHFYSYIELTAELPSRDYDVRVRYHDTDTSKDYSYCYMTSGTTYADPSSTFVFNAAIAPANLSASNPIIVDCSNDGGSTYTELFRVESDKALEAGKHYRIKKEVVVPLKGFPTDAAPIFSMKKGSIILSKAITAEGLDLQADADISDALFYIGYNERAKQTGLITVSIFDIFNDVTWSTSERFSTRPYLSLTENANGTINLKVNRLPLSQKKTIEITATAPNRSTLSFDVHLIKPEPEPTDDAPTSVTLDRDLFVANIDAAMTLSATVLPDETGINKTLNWTSSDTSVATVDANGKVTTKGGGVATITATAASGGEKAECTVRVNGSLPAMQYKIGDYYPNDDEPIGVVFMVDVASVNGYSSSGKVIAFDSFAAEFSTVNDSSVVTVPADGYTNMCAFYQTDSDFSNYPAFKWVAEKNAVDFKYTSGAKDQWYLASDAELRQLMAGMCGYKMIGMSDLSGEGCIRDWNRNFPMSINGSGYTPDIAAFNKKITDMGGDAISDSLMPSSTIDFNTVYALYPDTGLVQGKSKSYKYTNVRAIMAFNFYE